MSIHKLTAGSGYTYLTRQVAAHDATDKGGVGLATYYTARGETPGMWVGSGMAGIEGLNVGDEVTQAQMQSLFGSGHHPLADQREAALKESQTRQSQSRGRERADPLSTHEGDSTTDASQPAFSAADYRHARRLGTPFRVYADDVSPFRIEVARRYEALNIASGLPHDSALPAEDRAKIRTQVATEFFRAEHSREPADARELAATIARHTRPKTTAVAGFDLTFSPVKSVSTLWAIADPAIAARIEVAHRAAINDALRFIEQHALFTRVGAGGVRQIDVRGLVATAFTHRDSRAGDPDLHTHIAVANKVQALDGRWLAIDGRVLYKATVAASETYNTALEKHLSDGLGVRFAERPNPTPGGDRRKRPIREIVGVDPALNQRWSARRAKIEVRRSELAATFQATHGRPPSPVEALHLAQQATLETRDAKHEPRSLAEQRDTWRTQAIAVMGGEQRLAAMVSHALHPDMACHPTAPTPNSQWFAQTAANMLTTLEERRSTWQVWHVRAEAQRRAKTADLTGLSDTQVTQLVDLLTDDVLNRSVSLSRPEKLPDNPSEPRPLRRIDGTSAYIVAGSTIHTSSAILAAEQRIVEAAGRDDGHRLDLSRVSAALAESAANDLPLNAGQAQLVADLATSGRRVQLAIAPAGSGKTTAMSALTQAWTDAGGTVVGLAPSAAAAGQLGHAIGTAATADTLAKLVWSIDHNDLPGWAKGFDSKSLVVIDEAGMADTLSLDKVVTFVLARGGSVRLVGDDQQLAAIGAGGVLRDLATTHGALRLTELMRFADPAESAASLALREGRTEALGFYLDHQRVHVGDLATMTDDVLDAWQTDRANGRDSIMLAPTRDLVSELNQRARAHRLALAPDANGPARALADGNDASSGDLIITRANDRSLRTAATDWVKNGDRWTVIDVQDRGDLTVQHTQSGRRIRLPSEYVDDHTELGYATTVHTAQGVTADTMHGLTSGQESRQQLYTMLTRGRTANHVYLEVVGDGDPHSVIRPEMIRPETPTDVLERMLARDDSPTSATSLVREQAEPARQLGDAAARYLDALYVAAEATAPPTLTTRLDQAAEHSVPGLTHQQAWPSLRAHLLLLAANDIDPITELQMAVAQDELDTAHDAAAVLAWRVDDSGLGARRPGPLPWLPGVPTRLATHPEWGSYLTARVELINNLAARVHAEPRTSSDLAWARDGFLPDDRLAAEVQVWRAATGVEPTDRRPTGPPAKHTAQARYQHRLDRRLVGDRAPALREWGHLLEAIAPAISRDDFTPHLAERLAAVSRSGLDTPALLQRVTGESTQPLPDDHAAAALWWRLSTHLTPAVAASVAAPNDLGGRWTSQLLDLVGTDRAERLQSSTWWSALTVVIDQALRRGWQLETLVSRRDPSTDSDLNECQSLVWRISIALDPIPLDQGYGEPDHPDPLEPAAPEDLWDGLDGNRDLHWPLVPELTDEQITAELDALFQARATNIDPPELSNAALARIYDRQAELDQSPISEARLLEVNALAQAYFEEKFVGSWGQAHLTERLRVDLTGHEHFRPGQAPAGWTNLVRHLHGEGVTNEELLATGLASTSRNGRLIDRFRDRVLFAIARPNGTDILGFIGRRHPDLTDQGDTKVGPKYLNTADTALFHKGAQLFGALNELLDHGATPVIVEGPLDAIAVTLATAGAYVGVAPLGTSLTEDQALQLSAIRERTGAQPVVAMDPDDAGQAAAERAFWNLTSHNLNPGYVQLPQNTDPADLLTDCGPAALAAALAQSRFLGDHLIDELLLRRSSLTNDAELRTAAAQTLAAYAPQRWEDSIERIAMRLELPEQVVRRDLYAVTSESVTAQRLTETRDLPSASDEVRAIGDNARRRTRPPVEPPGRARLPINQVRR